ncbi:MAG: hypothetical protein K2J51_01890 [Alistipes sp.]|nr:hypothetical protein [Alistipes sp.]
MDRNILCGALYALPEGYIVKRRKSPAVPLAMFAAGIAVIAVNQFLPSTADWVDLRSVLALAGMVLLFAGGIVAALRLFGSGGIPYHVGRGCYLRYDEKYYDKAHLRDVARCVAEGDVEGLSSLPRTSIPAVTVAEYRSQDGGFVAMQAFEYVDLEDREICPLKILER